MSKLVIHPFKPFFNSNSKILILGTMPSPKARFLNFYYGNPQNRFWKILSDIFKVKLETNEDKLKLLSNKKIALWDVIYSCEIDKAGDSTIKNVVPNDLSEILKICDIKAIFTTGKKAYDLYNKYIYPKTKMNAILLPSSSPANCAMKYDVILKEYSIILEYL